MENFIIIALVLLVVGLAALYIYKVKKRGDKCIGCPYAKNCNGKCNND